MTFESFVAGPSNEFAVSVARQVAAWTNGGFNPVLIHGPYGFGKTHLLNAIGWEAARVRPDAKIVYLTAEQFTSTFVRAVMDRTGPAFKGDLRAADMLLIDDVHFIGGKKSSQEELFHTLAALIGEGKRVVFSADKPAFGPGGGGSATAFPPRRRSWSAAWSRRTVTCGSASLSKSSPRLSRQLGFGGQARGEVLEMLADRFPDSVRELEGGLNTLAFRAGDRLWPP